MTCLSKGFSTLNAHMVRIVIVIIPRDMLPKFSPHGDAGGLSRNYVLRIPSVS